MRLVDVLVKNKALIRQTAGTPGKPAYPSPTSDLRDCFHASLCSACQWPVGGAAVACAEWNEPPPSKGVAVRKAFQVKPNPVRGVYRHSPLTGLLLAPVPGRSRCRRAMRVWHGEGGRGIREKSVLSLRGDLSGSRPAKTL